MAKKTKPKAKEEFDKDNPYARNYRRSTFFKILITALFWLFVISTTTILILFSEGYSVSIDEKKITQNGVITVNSTPERAIVYVNGTRRGTTPLHLPSVKPGTHKIEVVKEGFTTWTEDIFLVKKRAVEVNAVLFKNDGGKTLLSSKNISKIYLAENADQMIFTVGNQDGTNTIYHRPFNFFLWDLTKEDTEVYTLPNSASTLQISPNGSQTLITSDTNLFDPLAIKTEGQEFYYLIENVENSTPVVLTELEQFGEIKHVKWPVASENKLLVETNNQVISYDVQTRQAVILYNFPTGTSPIYTATRLSNLIYINPSDGLPYVVSLQGTNKQVLLTDNVAISFQNPQKISVEARERFIIVHDEEKISYIETTRPLANNQTVQGLLNDFNISKVNIGGISPNGEWLYFRDEAGDLYVYNLETIETAAKFNETDSIIKAIPSEDIELDQVFKWHPNSTNLLTLPVRKSGIAAVKTFNVKNRNYQILYKGYIASMEFGVSNDGDKVLFLVQDEMNNSLYQIDLLDNGVIRLGLLDHRL